MIVQIKIGGACRLINMDNVTYVIADSYDNCNVYGDVVKKTHYIMFDIGRGTDYTYKKYFESKEARDAALDKIRNALKKNKKFIEIDD